MKTADQLLLFLHSAAWAEHKIGSAYEAAIDMIANNTAKSDISIDALSKRWHVHRDTARKYFYEAQQIVAKWGTEAEIDTKANADDLRHMLTVFGINADDLRHNPSRDNINLNVFSDEKTNKKIKRVRENFVRPSPEEVNAYLRQIGETDIDGQAFCDYYECCGWVVGRDRKPMKSWQAAVRYWQRNRKKQPSFQSSNTPHHHATSPTPHRYPSDRAAERAERQQQFAQHIQRLLDDPGAEQQPTLDF